MLTEAALCWNRVLMRVMLWLVMLWLVYGEFRYGSSFDPQCTVFSCYRPVCCKFCLHCTSSHWSSSSVLLPVCLWRVEITVASSSHEQFVSFRYQSGAVWLETNNVLVIFTELNENLDKLGQRVVSSAKRVNKTTDASGEESIGSPGRQNVLNKKTYKMKSSATDKLGRFLITGPTDGPGKTNHFYCGICRKDVSVLINGPNEILRHLQGARHFPHYHLLRLQTPGWQALDFESKPLSDDELLEDVSVRRSAWLH